MRLERERELARERGANKRKSGEGDDRGGGSGEKRARRG
jgi:hypothetical protein